MRRMRSACCACAASGHEIAAPPTNEMNSRRLIASPRARDTGIVAVRMMVVKGRSMSALGQKQTCAVQNGMSALPPIATAKADMLEGHSALPPKADMCGALGDVRFGPKVDIHRSFDHLVGKGQKLGGNL